MRHLSESRQALVRIGLMVLLVGVPILCLIPLNMAKGKQEAHKCISGSMRVIEDGSLVRAVGDKPITIFAHTDVGAEILFFTPYRIIASNYHREGKGIQYVWEAGAIKNWDELYHYFAERHVDVVMYCPSPVAPEDGVLQKLFRGEKPPRWMKPIALEKPTDPSLEETDITPSLYRIKY
jgi:hypothetical protein